MEFLTPWSVGGGGFFPKNHFVQRGYHYIHFYPLPKPTQNFPMGKALILRIIRKESKKVLEKCALQCHTAKVTLWSTLSAFSHYTGRPVGILQNMSLITTTFGPACACYRFRHHASLSLGSPAIATKSIPCMHTLSAFRQIPVQPRVLWPLNHCAHVFVRMC